MSFASLTFFLFLPLVFAAHWAGRGRRWQNAVLLLASYLFYAWWDWRFCGLMLTASLSDWAVGRALGRTRAPGKRRLLLGVSLLVDLGLLGFFKYFNFFADSLALALAAAGVEINTSSLNLVLPVGISFYTFQTLSYTLDIYGGRQRPHRGLLEYLAFVSFFPQLVAGPIERARELLPQFCRRRTFSPAWAVSGCRLILWGLAKKLLLADHLGTVVDAVYVRADTAGAAELALATLAFAFQIYADFAAYSDIAAGVGRLFGIRLTRNFALPYFAPNLAEFWRRWHVTLSRWFRDYVYIPLGGSRVPWPRHLANLMATFLLSGLWHGAAWHFVAWGGWHGLGVVVAHLWRERRRRRGEIADRPWTRALSGGATFLFVSAGWVWFRAASVDEAARILGRIAAGAFNPAVWAGLGPALAQNAAWLAGLGGFVLIEWLGRARWNPLAWERLPRPARWAGYTALLWAILLWGGRSTEFIYFQF